MVLAVFGPNDRIPRMLNAEGERNGLLNVGEVLARFFAKCDFNRALRGIYLRGQGRGQIFGQLVLVVLDEGLQVGRDAGNRFEGFAQRVIAMDVNLRDVIEQPPSDAADVGLSHRNDMQQTGRELERAGEDRLLGRVIL